MVVLQWILALLLGAVLLAAVARSLGVPSPSMLALGGVAIALLNNGPWLSLDPDLALALFVAPVLLDAAFDSPLRELRDYWLPVTSMIVLAVGVTTAAVALVAHWLVPAMPWAVAVALGAVVAPPDAAAATAVLKEVKLPHRLLAILEGEGLLNDASALLIYRLAVGAAVAHAGTALGVASTLVLEVAGSVAMGIVFAFAFGYIVPLFPTRPVRSSCNSSALLECGSLPIAWVCPACLRSSPSRSSCRAALQCGYQPRFECRLMQSGKRQSSCPMRSPSS